MLASGVCHSDLHVRDGEWQRPGPVVIGHEGAGVVEALGPGVDPVATRAGRRAARRPVVDHRLRPLPIVSRRSDLGVPGLAVVHASDGRTEARGCGGASGEELLSYCAIGTMAEAQVVPAAAAIPMPDGTPPDVAALIGCCVATGVGAVTKTVPGRAGVERRRHRARRRRAVGGHGRGARGGRADHRGRSRRREARTGEGGRGDRCDPRRRRRRRDGCRDPRRHRRGPGRLRRGDRAGRDDRARDRLPAERRNGAARRDDAVRGARLVRGLPVRRRRSTDRGVELRVGGAVGRLPAVRGSCSSTAACRSTGSSPTGSGSTVSRRRSTGCGAARACGRSSSSEPSAQDVRARSARELRDRVHGVEPNGSPVTE